MMALDIDTPEELFRASVKTILVVGFVALIIYGVWFLGANHEAMIHNMGNPCVITPLNFGACTP